MLPAPPELFDLVATDRRAREARAAAERLRGPSRLRTRTAAVLRHLADRLAPAPSGAPADGGLAHR
jgi:hypothetical protein